MYHINIENIYSATEFFLQMKISNTYRQSCLKVSYHRWKVFFMATLLTGKITKILSREKHGRCRFSFTCAAGDLPRNEWNEITCDYFFSRCYINLPVKISGNLHAQIFVADSVEPYYTSDNELADFLSSSCPGVGTKIANAIANYYHASLYNYNSHSMLQSLSEEKEQIFSDLKRKPSMAKLSAIAEAITFDRPGFDELENFLYPLNVSVECATEIYNKHGVDSISIITDHPYQMGTRFHLSMYAMEKIAKSAGISPFSKERVVGLVYSCVSSCISSGNTYMHYTDLLGIVQSLSLKYAYQCLIPEIVISDSLLEHKYFFYKDGLVTFPYIRNAEIHVASVLKSLNVHGGLPAINKEQICEIEQALGITYSTEQIQAFKLLETSGVKILTGGPGTGKTTLMNGLLRAFIMNSPGKSFALCAPTARAAKRLSEATGYDAETIHRTIGFNPFDTAIPVRYDQYHPLPYDVIIVDEASMIDIILFRMLIDAVKPGAILIVSGDIHQLPSVSPGNVLHDLIACGRFECVSLKTVYRQSGDSSIISNATRILNQQFPISAPDFHLCQVSAPEDGFQILSKFVLRSHDPDNPFSFQLIQPSYKGVCGINAINSFMQIHLHANENCRINGTPLPGDKAIFSRTDRDHGYMNGEIVVIKDITDSGIVVSDGVSLSTYPKTVLKDMQLAFSYSIHRAQGCENDIIVIYLPENTSKTLLTNSLLYTAVTRAKKEVYIIYENNALSGAIHNTESVMRNSYLEKALQ